jgi:hypothetical protein
LPEIIVLGRAVAWKMCKAVGVANGMVKFELRDVDATAAQTADRRNADV